MESIKDIVREMRKLAEIIRKKERVDGYEIVDAWAGYEHFANRIEKAAHNNPKCINCVAVEKWKAKQAAAKAKEEVAK